MRLQSSEVLAGTGGCKSQVVHAQGCHWQEASFPLHWGLPTGLLKCPYSMVLDFPLSEGCKAKVRAKMLPLVSESVHHHPPPPSTIIQPS